MKNENKKQIELNEKNGWIEFTPGYYIHKTGEVYSAISRQFIKQQNSSVYNIFRANNKNWYTHLVVANAFVKGKKKGYVVDHIDNDVLNNCYRNLRFIPEIQNLQKRKVYENKYNKDLKKWLLENINFLSVKKLSEITGYTIRYIFKLRADLK